MINVLNSFNSERKTICFVHGFMESSAVWNTASKAFSDRFNCVALSLPGHFKSEENPCFDDIYELLSRWKQVLDTHQISTCHFVAHSMGAYLTAAFKARFPEHAEQVVVINSTLLPDTKQQSKQRALFAKLSPTKFELLSVLAFQKYNSLNCYSVDYIESKTRFAQNLNPKHLIHLQQSIAKRKDLSELLNLYSEDFYFIFSEKDEEVPWKAQIKKWPSLNHTILKNQSHLLPEDTKLWTNLVLDFFL
ncbi:MAG: alpha/beta hydrolase [Flavobacteriales bacterium]